MNCVICNNPLKGKQSKFCSKKCKKERQNNSYEAQQVRAFKRKQILVEKSGGRCSICGYDKNYSALHFHHVDPNNKLFNLDSRNLSNRSMSRIKIELAKTILLCGNCHAETHHPHLDCKKSSF